MSSKYGESGKFLGVDLKTASQLEGGEDRIIAGKPFGTLDEVGGRGKTPYFGLRLAYVEGGFRGDSIRQALIGSFGAPAWINL